MDFDSPDMDFDYPVLWCLVCVPTGTVEYSSINKNSVDGFYGSMPEDVREVFEVVMYRANKMEEKSCS